MKRFWKRGTLFVTGCLMGIMLGQALTAFTQDSGVRNPVPEGVFINLTNDFYKALREEGSGSAKNYSNDMSLTYLREISVSTRFMVETNLQVLKNQERIIQMLESRRK